MQPGKHGRFRIFPVTPSGVFEVWSLGAPVVCGTVTGAVPAWGAALTALPFGFGR